MRVLLAVDGSQPARWAQDTVPALPLPRPLEVMVVTVLDIPRPRFTSLTPLARQAYSEALAGLRLVATETAEDALRHARGRLEECGASGTVRVQEGPRAAEIIETAEMRGADLVVVGSRGLGPVKEFLLGSVSQKVIRYAPCSVLVVKQPVHRVQRVLVAMDGSGHAEAGVNLLARLPLPAETAIHLCTVVELPELFSPKKGSSREERAAMLRTLAEDGRVGAERLLAEASALLARSGCTVTASVKVGHAPNQLLAAVGHFKPDLLVLGAKGHTASKRFVLGTVAQKMVKYAPCSVLVVRPPSTSSGSSAIGGH